MRVVSLSLFVAGAIACSGTPAPDAAVADAWPRPCWGGGGSITPDTELMLGFGMETFTEMVPEQVLDVAYGFQGGSHFDLHARMRGLSPGDLDDRLGPSPHIHFSAYTDDGAQITFNSCSFPGPFRPLDDGWFEMPIGRSVIIDRPFTGQLEGERIRIRGEMQDPDGRYVMAETWVVARDDNPLADAGPVDANGPADAGVPNTDPRVRTNAAQP